MRQDGCPDQDNWSDFIEVKGDAQAMEDLRVAMPGKTHCSLLMQSPNACSGCEKNPERDVIPGSGEMEYEALQERIEDAFETSALMHTGFQISLSEIPWLASMELLVLRSRQEAKRQRESKPKPDK